MPQTDHQAAGAPNPLIAKLEGFTTLSEADRAMLEGISKQHGANAGKWFLEAGFGRVDDLSSPLFAHLDEAQAWIVDQL